MSAPLRAAASYQVPPVINIHSFLAALVERGAVYTGVHRTASRCTSEGAAGMGSVGDGIGEGAHSLAWTLHCNVCGSDLFDNQEHLAFCICHSIVRLRVEPRSASVVRVVRVVLALYVSNVRACCPSSHASTPLICILYILICIYRYIHTCIHTIAVSLGLVSV